MTKKHGLTAYASGACRCRTCKAAWASYIRLRRRRQRLGRGRARTSSSSRRRPYYRNADRVAIGLTPLSLRILLAAERRSARTLDDIVEDLVRTHGPAVAAA